MSEESALEKSDRLFREYLDAKAMAASEALRKEAKEADEFARMQERADKVWMKTAASRDPHVKQLVDQLEEMLSLMDEACVLNAHREAGLCLVNLKIALSKHLEKNE